MPAVESIVGGVRLSTMTTKDSRMYFCRGLIPSLKKDGRFLREPAPPQQRRRTLTDVTRSAGLEGAGYSVGVAAEDCANGTFSDVTEHAGTLGARA
jgi:hypothetical protein